MATTAETESTEGRTGTQTVERAISILSCFRDGPHDLGISEIARLTHLNVSTAHRIVRALVTARFMEQDERTERYRLGSALAVLGQRALEGSGFSLAQPVLDRLAADSGESVSLGVRRDDEVVVLLTAVSTQRLRFDHPTGAGIKLHASAMGKALLAFSGASARTAASEAGELERYTAHTVTSRATLVAQLEKTREIGYAVNHEERYEGVIGVAAPVVGSDGVARAAIGLQGPTIRITADRIASLGAAVRAAADEVSSLLSLRR